METIEEHPDSLPAVRPFSPNVLHAAAVGLLVLLTARLTVESFTVPSGSMSPLLEPGDSLLVTRLPYFLHPPRRRDIILFRSSQDQSRIFVKRVIGLPGEMVEERGGLFYVNNRPLAQGKATGPGADHVAGMTMAPMRVLPGQLFVLGDNPEASLDSRFWGTVDEHNVIGKAFLIYWSRGNHWGDVRWQRIGRWLR